MRCHKSPREGPVCIRLLRREKRVFCFTVPRRTCTRMSQTEADYSAWSREQLLQRVTSLEQRLRSSNNESHVECKTKAERPFDASRYSTRLIALKFAYLGQHYNGLEFHANNPTPLPTVEEELWKALVKAKLIFGQGSLPNWTDCNFAKCGRTDRGVSAFGQVVSLRVRSGQDELPYSQILNRLLPPSIRILAWCYPPNDFSARFNCKARTYKYFFTNPAFSIDPTELQQCDGITEGGLDIPRMQEAANSFIGLHDFRNFSKLDASKQLTHFSRRIYSTCIEEHAELGHDVKVYSFTLTGSAFLWHQVRHMMAVLFLVGQGREDPSIVRTLLDAHSVSGKPMYEMADDKPLVLWNCTFSSRPRERAETKIESEPWKDEIKWTYVGDQPSSGSRSAKFGPMGLVPSLWTQWQQSKMDEILSNKLLGLVMNQGLPHSTIVTDFRRSDKIYQGGSSYRLVGRYTKILDRNRLQSVETVNERWLAKQRQSDQEIDFDVST